MVDLKDIEKELVALRKNGVKIARITLHREFDAEVKGVVNKATLITEFNLISDCGNLLRSGKLSKGVKGVLKIALNDADSYEIKVIE